MCIVIDPKFLVRKEPNVDIEDEAEELPPQRTVVPARAPALEEEVEELEEMMEDVSLSTFVAVGLDEKYPHIALPHRVHVRWSHECCFRLPGPKHRHQ